MGDVITTPLNPSPTRPIRHLFTVDVEEHFQVHALEGAVDREAWSGHPSRVEASTERLLELLDRAGAVGTFFVLGWVARRNAGLVKQIAEAGHEIASHGMNHRRLGELDRDGFRETARDSRALLEDIAGTPVRGFRAPSFSLGEEKVWALEILLEEGYAYDASRMPVRRPSLSARAALDAHFVQTLSGPILEIPVVPAYRGRLAIPAGGGAYFRHLPYALTRAALRSAEKRGHPGVFYVHPWELDPDQPRLTTSPITRLRHYGGLARTADRLRRLLGEFEFGSVRDVYRRQLSPAVAPEAGRESAEA